MCSTVIEHVSKTSVTGACAAHLAAKGTPEVNVTVFALYTAKLQFTASKRLRYNCAMDELQQL